MSDKIDYDPELTVALTPGELRALRAFAALPIEEQRAFSGRHALEAMRLAVPLVEAFNAQPALLRSYPTNYFLYGGK